MAEEIFRADKLTRIYRSGEVDVYALREASLTFYAGEITVLLGPSGSGKSTLLNILGGLDRPDGGEAWFKNECLNGFSERQLTFFRRNHVGFVFQFYNLMPSLTARENVALAAEIARDPMPPEEALTMVGLEKRLDHFPSQLSGGEQQRVAIARAIAKKPEVLLCDEPTGALDSKTGIQVLEALVQVNQTLNTTVAIITHNASIRKIAHRVFYFLDGRIARTEVNETRLATAEVEW